MIEPIIRKLARSYKYQFIYARAKELGNIRFFKNDSDLSKIQIIFLQYLEVYNSLYTDLASNKEYISETVIEDDLRCDSYLLYRRKKEAQENKNIKTKNKKVDNPGKVPDVIFE